jgi:hypothetical protein
MGELMNLPERVIVPIPEAQPNVKWTWYRADDEWRVGRVVEIDQQPWCSTHSSILLPQHDLCEFAAWQDIKSKCKPSTLATIPALGVN